MTKETFQTGRTPQIEIGAVAGDLVIRPWMSLDVEARGAFVQEGKDGALHFEAEGDLVLKVPEQASIRVRRVSGDLVIKSVSGEVDINEVHGDAVFSNLGQVTVRQIHGDLVARHLSAALQIAEVFGDTVLRGLDGGADLGALRGDVVAQYVNGGIAVSEAGGDITLAAVSGDVLIGHGLRDLNLREIGGLVQAKEIAGDVRLRGGLRAGEHVLAAQGDIIIRWPAALPLTVSILATAVHNGLPLEDVTEDESGYRGHIGSDGAYLSLNAGGKVVLKEAQLIRKKWSEEMGATFENDFFSGLGNLGAQIAEEVNREISAKLADFETTVAPGLQKLGEQFAQKATEAADMARAVADELSEKERAYAEKVAAPQSRSGPKAREESPSAIDEQLRILKMVEKGVITPEEANLLLEALEGN